MLKSMITAMAALNIFNTKKLDPTLKTKNTIPAQKDPFHHIRQKYSRYPGTLQKKKIHNRNRRKMATASKRVNYAHN